MNIRIPATLENIIAKARDYMAPESDKKLKIPAAFEGEYVDTTSNDKITISQTNYDLALLDYEIFTGTLERITDQPDIPSINTLIIGDYRGDLMQLYAVSPLSQNPKGYNSTRVATAIKENQPEVIQKAIAETSKQPYSLTLTPQSEGLWKGIEKTPEGSYELLLKSWGY